MRYREIGSTGVRVSEVGFGGEWASPDDPAHARALVERCERNDINILDCWMSDPGQRSNLGTALEGHRDRWIIQGHIGSTWKDGQYKRTREIEPVKEAFEDLLARFRTDYIDFGMLHYIDVMSDYRTVMEGDVLSYAHDLKAAGRIRHIGMSTHNPAVALAAAKSGQVELILFSCNPAFDLVSADTDLDDFFNGKAFENDALAGIAPDRAELYRTCEERGVGITVMKGFAGGRLLNADDSPFGKAFTPIQCIHYALTRPAVASVMVGFSEPEQVDVAEGYEAADAQTRDYASVLAGAPHHAFFGQCTYCGHCAPCPQDIEIAYVNKFADLASAHETVPPSVAEHYAALSAHASDCIGCGQCEKRCPFGVEVVEKMKQTAALFGK